MRAEEAKAKVLELDAQCNALKSACEALQTAAGKADMEAIHQKHKAENLRQYAHDLQTELCRLWSLQRAMEALAELPAGSE